MRIFNPEQFSCVVGFGRYSPQTQRRSLNVTPATSKEGIKRKEGENNFLLQPEGKVEVPTLFLCVAPVPQRGEVPRDFP